MKHRFIFAFEEPKNERLILDTNPIGEDPGAWNKLVQMEGLNEQVSSMAGCKCFEFKINPRISNFKWAKMTKLMPIDTLINAIWYVQNCTFSVNP